MVLSSRGSPIPPPPAFAAAKSRAEPSRPFEKQRMRRSCAQIHAPIRSLRGERLTEARQVAPCLRLDKCPQLIPAYPVTHQSLRRPVQTAHKPLLGLLHLLVQLAVLNLGGRENTRQRNHVQRAIRAPTYPPGGENGSFRHTIFAAFTLDPIPFPRFKNPLTTLRGEGRFAISNVEST